VDLPSLLALAVGLAMDATAVSAARGLAVPELRPRHALAVALWFGGFQAGMPLIGWLVGDRIGPWVEAWDHWIAFGLLAALGARMIAEAIGEPDDDAPADPRPFRPGLMLPLAVATSIDALAAGITLPMLGASLPVALAVIGLVTALFSAVGLYAGRRLGQGLGRRLDAIGGVVLIVLGARILIEHLAG